MHEEVSNKIQGEIEDIRFDGLMAQITLWVGGWGEDNPRLTSVMTRDSLQDAGLKTGDRINALVKVEVVKAGQTH